MNEKSSKKVEAKRYRRLPVALNIFFLVSTFLGLLLAVVYLFALPLPADFILYNVGYYFLIVAFFLPSAFLILPMRAKDARVPWYDILAATLSFGICIYFFLHAEDIAIVNWAFPSPLNFSIALILCGLILEGARRTAGKAFLMIIIAIGAYPLFASYMPGPFYGVQFSLFNTIGAHIFGSEGLLGIPTKSMGEILIGFLLLAGILLSSGAGDSFLSFAQAILGRFRGGGAKVSVGASALFGMLSGSAVSNVAATGSITIPLMKRTGFKPEVAAAVESCSSTGGTIMPPVMGAVAFVMAQVIGRPYAEIMIAAIIPSILYFVALIVQIDFYAARNGLKGLRREEIPSLRKELLKNSPYIAVFLFLVWGLLYMRWEAMTPFYAAGLLFAYSLVHRKKTMMMTTIDSLTSIGRLISETMAIILPIGFIISGITITGVASSITGMLVSIAGGNIFVIVLLGIAVCYVFGMGGMLIASYIFLAVSFAPALITVGGFDPLAVHLFIVYYSMLSLISPPIALACFVAAKIAGAPPMKTAFLSMRLGVVLYLIPIAFLFKPALIFQGPIIEIIYLFCLSLIGVVIIGGGLGGYFWGIGVINWPIRLLFILAGSLLFFPGSITWIIGGILALLILIFKVYLKYTRRPIFTGYREK